MLKETKNTSQRSKINPRRGYNCKYICTQHKSSSIYKTNANSYKRRNQQKLTRFVLSGHNNSWSLHSPAKSLKFMKRLYLGLVKVLRSFQLYFTLSRMCSWNSSQCENSRQSVHSKYRGKGEGWSLPLSWSTSRINQWLHPLDYLFQQYVGRDCSVLPIPNFPSSNICILCLTCYYSQILYNRL